MLHLLRVHLLGRFPEASCQWSVVSGQKEQRTLAADLVGGNCLNDLAAAVAVDAASQLVVQGGDVVHGLSVVTGKPAGKRAQTGVCKISLAPGSEFCEGGIVQAPPSPSS